MSGLTGAYKVEVSGGDNAVTRMQKQIRRLEKERDASRAESNALGEVIAKVHEDFERLTATVRRIDIENQILRAELRKYRNGKKK